MAIRHFDVTLGAGATPISTSKYPMQWCLIRNATGNAAIYIGDSTVSATSYGDTLAADAKLQIGPGTQGFPMETDALYIFGTETQVVHVLALT